MSIDAAVSFLPLTARAGNLLAVVSFQPLTVSATASAYVGPTFAALTAFGTVVESAPGIGSMSFERMTASGTVASVGPVIHGAMSFLPMTASASVPLAVSVAFEAMTASGWMRPPINAAMSFKPMFMNSPSAALVFRPMTALGTVSVTLVETYQTFTMNTRNNYVTEYTNFNFNSYALIGNEYYAAGPSGLYRLDGVSDSGNSIVWDIKTGQMDDKQIGLKRLPEILMALRATGPVKVRVWKDDNTYYDYVLPAVLSDTIHQARVQPGKGMRSRYYAVELIGMGNTFIELDSMLVNMIATSRRLG